MLIASYPFENQQHSFGQWQCRPILNFQFITSMIGSNYIHQERYLYDTFRVKGRVIMGCTVNECRKAGVVQAEGVIITDCRRRDLEMCDFCSWTYVMYKSIQ